MKTLLLFILAAILVLARPAYAQTASPSSAPVENKTNLEELKDRLATVVAELRQTQRKAIFGTIKSTSITTAVIETKTKDLKIELVDELAVFQVVGGKRTELSVDDLASGDRVAVFGEYDTTLDLLTAKVVFIQAASPTRIAGTVTAVDEEEFTLIVQTKDGPAYTVDIERTTATQAWTGGDKVEKSGFSRIAIGDVVHIAGTPAAKQENRLSAARILDLGNLTGATPTPIPEATSSATPSATPQAE